MEPYRIRNSNLSTPEFGMRAASLAEIIQDSIRSFRIDEICFQHAIDSHSIHLSFLEDLAVEYMFLKLGMSFKVL